MKLTDSEVKELVKWIVSSGIKDAIEEYVEDARLKGQIQSIGLAFIAAGIRMYEKGVKLEKELEHEHSEEGIRETEGTGTKTTH